MRRALLFCLLVLGLAPSAHAQAIVWYEVNTQSSIAGAPTITLAAPASAVTCAVGRITQPQGVTVWVLPSDFIKVQFEPDDTRVCTWTGPAYSTLGLTLGATYTATITPVNEARLKGDASPASNPFGLALKPPTISRVAVAGG